MSQAIPEEPALEGRFPAGAIDTRNIVGYQEYQACPRMLAGIECHCELEERLEDDSTNPPRVARTEGPDDVAQTQ